MTDRRLKHWGWGYEDQQRPAVEVSQAAAGIRSVLGFGGLLHSGNFFAIILFSRVFVPPETTEMFKTLALSSKIAILPFEGNKVFCQ